VARVVEYILAGDIFQANVASASRRRCPRFDSFAFYRRCARSIPRHFRPTSTTAISSSPRLRRALPAGFGNRVEARPIKGTRPRGAIRKPMRIIAELLASRKDRAENVMTSICCARSLEACRPGSVRCRSSAVSESFASVHHLVLRPGRAEPAATPRPVGDAFRWLDPGAPKRAPWRSSARSKGARAGPMRAIGYLGFDGTMDTNRHQDCGVRQGVAVVQAGGGIVAASDPAAE